jgi:hypothetical protein
MIKIDFTHTQSHSITISNEQRNKKYLITRLILEINRVLQSWFFWYLLESLVWRKIFSLLFIKVCDKIQHRNRSQCQSHSTFPSYIYRYASVAEDSGSSERTAIFLLNQKTKKNSCSVETPLTWPL